MLDHKRHMILSFKKNPAANFTALDGNYDKLNTFVKMTNSLMSSNNFEKKFIY